MDWITIRSLVGIHVVGIMDIFVTSVETIVELINRFNKILLRILVVIMELAVVHDNPTISMYPPT